MSGLEKIERRTKETARWKELRAAERVPKHQILRLWQLPSQNIQL